MIQGKVTTANGQPMQFVNVYPSDMAGNLVGTVGAQTDINGNYTLLQAANGQYVTASFVGFTSKTQQVISPMLNFSLTEGVTLPGVTIISHNKAKAAAIPLIFALTVLAKAFMFK